MSKYTKSDISPDKSLLERALYGFDKLDAGARLLIGKKILGDEDTPALRDILTGKSRYEARDLVESAEKKTGMDLSFGEEGKETTFDNIANSVVDLGLYFTVSPTSALTGSASRAIGGAAKARGISEAGVQALQGAGTGAIIGGLSGDDMGDATIGALAGAGIGGLAFPIGKAGAKMAGKLGNKLVDRIAAGYNPEIFSEMVDGKIVKKMGYSDARNVYRNAQERLASVEDKIRQEGSALGLYDLGKVESAEMKEYLDSAYSRQVKFRNKLELDGMIKKAKIEDVDLSRLDGIVDLTKVKTYQTQRFGNRMFGDRIIDTGDGLFVSANGSSKFKPIASDMRDKALKQYEKIGMKEVDLISDEAKAYGLLDQQGYVNDAIRTSAEDLGKLTEQSNTFIGKLVDEELALEGKRHLKPLVDSWRKLNRKIVDEHNQYRKLIDPEHVDVVPIDFHVLEVKALDPKALDASSDALKRMKPGFHRRIAEEVQASDITLQELMRREAELSYKGMLSKSEMQAKRIVDSVTDKMKNNPDGDPFVAALDTFDGLTGFLKKQQLTFNHSWVVNNFSDNLIKAYMSGGVGNALDVAAMQTKALFRRETSDIMRDILKLTDPSTIKPKALQFESDVVKKALEHGVAEKGFFGELFDKQMLSKEMLATKYGTKEADAMVEAMNAKGDPKAAYDAYNRMLYNTIGRSGQQIETASRITTFKNVAKDILVDDDKLKALGVASDASTIKKMLKNGSIDDAIKFDSTIDNVYKEASRITNEAFFDYGNVNAFEQSFMKRIFPYYTFFSRNMDYWGKQLAENPDKVGRMLSLYKALGREPTDRERAMTPDYMLDQAVRISPDGRRITAPSVSFIDALNGINLKHTTLEKLHPTINLARTLLTGTTAIGQKIYPSETRTGQIKLSPQDTVQGVLSPTVHRDMHGNLVNTSDVFGAVNEIKKALLPTGLIDTGAKIVDTAVNRRDQLSDVVSSLGPVKSKSYTGTERQRMLNQRLRQMRIERERESAKD